MKRVIKLKGERNNFLLHLNDNLVMKKKWEGKISEQAVIVKEMMALGNQLKEKVSMFEH